MAAILLYSDRCNFSREVLQIIGENKTLASIVQVHNVSQNGVPRQFAGNITHVPTLVTKDGRFLVGVDVKRWLASVSPPEIDHAAVDGGGGAAMFTLDGGACDDGMCCSLDRYGETLQPPMPDELRAKIDANVTDAHAAAGR